MTPEQEAIEIYELFIDAELWSYEAVATAIICVDKIISVLEESNAAVGSLQLKINHYQEVKKEIEKL